MIIEMFFIYVMIVLAVLIVKAIGKACQNSPSCKSYEDLKEQIRKNREETKELKEKIREAGLDTLFPRKKK